MGRRLTDRQLADLWRLHRSGASQKVLASRFGVSQSHVSRLVRGERREDAPPAVAGPVRRALDAWLAELELSGRSALSLLTRDDELVLRLGDASSRSRGPCGTLCAKRARRDARARAGRF